MLVRYKTFDATGIAPAGRIFAGDLNAIQDALASQSNFSQTIDVSTLRIGNTGLQILQSSSTRLRVSGQFITDGIIYSGGTNAGGIVPGTYTTTQRNAIASNLRPYGMAIVNTTTNQWEWNSSSDGTPSWKPVGLDTTTNLTFTGSASYLTFTGQSASNTILSSQRSGDSANRVTLREDGYLQLGPGSGAIDTGTWYRLSIGVIRTPSAVTVDGLLTASAGVTVAGTLSANVSGDLTGTLPSPTVAAGAITLAKISGTLKPSVSAAAADEALRALGTSASTAAAGNDARLSDTRTPTDNTVGASKIINGVITNAHIATGAGIVYSKLTLTGSLVNADIASGAAIVYSKLSLTGSLLNADVNAAAGIVYTKLNLTGGIVNTDIKSTAAIGFSKLAHLPIQGPTDVTQYRIDFGTQAMVNPNPGNSFIDADISFDFTFGTTPKVFANGGGTTVTAITTTGFHLQAFVGSSSTYNVDWFAIG